MKLAKERFKLDIRKHFFSQRVVNRWNGPSGEVVSAGTVEAFKRRLDELRMEKKDLLMDRCSLDPKPTQRELWFGRTR